MRDKVLIISNESISKKNENYYCDNLDIKSIPEDLTKRSKVKLIGRLSKVERYHKIEKSGFNIIAAKLIKLTLSKNR